VASAAILTIGNELVSGDVPNSNGAWLARRLEGLGIGVHLIAAIPDQLERIAAFVGVEAPRADVLVVTGGLGGTPDDITREAIAAAFDVGQQEVPDLAERLRERFHDRGDPEYAARWARLPEGSRALENPLGGAPGFVIGNVYVLPGLPAEMEAMFGTVEDELRRPQPIGSWRRRYRTRESTIVGVLEAMEEHHPGVLVGSYPTFGEGGPEVEVVVKSSDPEALAAATTWIEAALDEATRP
jgi:molybdenum cofactor synthesis domain-containing protein